MARAARQTEASGLEKHTAEVDQLIHDVHALTTQRMAIHAQEKEKRAELIAALEAQGLGDGDEVETHDGFKATLRRGKTKVSVAQPPEAN